MDILPTKVPKGRFFTRANISKNIKLKTYKPPTINVRKYRKKINERVKTKRLVTLSPLTPMATHFHISNGAKQIAINDTSQNFEYKL